MNIKSRLRKLESSSNLDKDLCRCPDALCLAGTPYWKTCYQCGRVIELNTWKSWVMVDSTIETCFYAFGLRRDDRQALADKPIDYFREEVLLIRDMIYLKNIGA